MGKIKKLWTVGSGYYPERGGPSGFRKMEKLWAAGARLHGIGSLFPVANSSPITRLRDSDTAGLPKHRCPVIITELPGAHRLPELAQPTSCVPANKNTRPGNQRRTFPWAVRDDSLPGTRLHRNSRCCTGLKADAVHRPLQDPAGESKHLSRLQEVLPLTVSANAEEDVKESVTPPG